MIYTPKVGEVAIPAAGTRVRIYDCNGCKCGQYELDGCDVVTVEKCNAESITFKVDDDECTHEILTADWCRDWEYSQAFK